MLLPRRTSLSQQPMRFGVGVETGPGRRKAPKLAAANALKARDSHDDQERYVVVVAVDVVVVVGFP